MNSVDKSQVKYTIDIRRSTRPIDIMLMKNNLRSIDHVWLRNLRV